MPRNNDLTLYRVVLVHDTFDHVKITVEFPEKAGLSSEEQWHRAIVFTRFPTNEFKLESATPLGTVSG